MKEETEGEERKKGNGRKEKRKKVKKGRNNWVGTDERKRERNVTYGGTKEWNWNRTSTETKGSTTIYMKEESQENNRKRVFYNVDFNNFVGLIMLN